MLRDWRQWSGAKGHGCPCACQAWPMWYLRALSVARKGRKTRNRATTSHEPGRVNRVNRLHLRIAHKLQRKTCAGETIFRTLPVNHHRIITANWSRGRHGCGSVANVARRNWASWSAYKHVLCGFATPTDPLNSAFGLPLQTCPVWPALGALHPPFRSAMYD